MIKMEKETAEIEEPREIIENLDRISERLSKSIQRVEISPRRTKKHRRPRKTFKKKYLFFLIVNIGWWFLTKKISTAKLPIFTADLPKVLPFAYFLLTADFVANLLFLFLDESKTKNLILLILQFLTLSLTYRLLSVFPFNFSSLPIEGLEMAVSTGLLVITVGLGAMIIIQVLTVVLKP